jgi:hypothetical protein
VGIDDSQLARLLIGDVLTPNLAVGDEETLLRRVAVDRLHRRVSDNVHQRHVGQFRATVVGSVLAQRQAAIELHVALRILHADEAGILISGAGSALLKGLAVFRSPPIFEIAIGVEFASLVVEAVRQFVSDYHADAAVVYRVVHVLTVERRL